MSGIRAEAATLRSEKSTDIRQTNIIAAKGKSFNTSSPESNFNLNSCRRCRAYFPRPQRYGQDGKF